VMTETKKTSMDAVLNAKLSRVFHVREELKKHQIHVLKYAVMESIQEE